MLQSIILQTIFLSFTLLGCSENIDVCGNENGGGQDIVAMRRMSKRGGECYNYSINFYNPENKININNFKIDKNDYVYLENIKTMSYLNFNKFETIEKIKAILKELNITDYVIQKFDENCEIEYTEIYRNGKLINQMEMIIRISDKDTIKKIEKKIKKKIIEKKLNNIMFSKGKEWNSFKDEDEDDEGYGNLHIRFSKKDLKQIEEIIKSLNLEYKLVPNLEKDVKELQDWVKAFETQLKK